MKALFGLLLSSFILLLSACVTAPPPSPPDAAFAALNLSRVPVGPVTYATYQPNESCSLFIDEELRSALIIKLRLWGYDAFAVGNSIPRSFSAGAPPPPPSDSSPTEKMQSPGTEGILMVSIDEYREHNPCGLMEAGNPSITMGAVAALYAGSPSVEIWRNQARVEQGVNSGRDLIWLTTTRLIDQLLESLPAGPGWSKKR
jgi:hypothetical protein